MTIDGTITAGGLQGVCPSGGGGAGGSIYINSSTTISGTGSITANGKLFATIHWLMLSHNCVCVVYCHDHWSCCVLTLALRSLVCTTVKV
jgi:hypothetical protein